MFIENGDTVLFMGDSITDRGRHSDDERPYSGANLGVGYVMMASSMIKAYHPEWNIEFINKGTASDSLDNLMARWQQDALDTNPDVLSILIGVNDVYKNVFEYNGAPPRGLSVDDLAKLVEERYRHILTLSRNKNPNLKIIMMEPFLFPITDSNKKARPYLDAVILVVRKLAKEFGARLVPLDGIMISAFAGKKEEDFWVEKDGVHPNWPGNALIAKNWLETAFR